MTLQTLFILISLSLFAFLQNSKAEVLQELRANDKRYFTLDSIQKSFELNKKTRNKHGIKISNEQYEINLSIGSKTCYMNGIKFEFGNPTIIKDGKVIVSALDVETLIRPILRPLLTNEKPKLNIIIIDPGHGGKDSGALCRFGTEAKINLSIAKKLKSHLQDRGYKVVLTRETDKFLTLQERVDIGNRHDDAIFISIHQNSFRSPEAQGFETFTMSPVGVGHPGRKGVDDDNLLQIGNLNDSANIALATAIHGTCVRNLKLQDRGLQRARFNVISQVRHPSVLIECGFLSHPVEGGKLSNPRYQEAFARCLTNAIFKYKNALGLGQPVSN